jgi:hypothetical protein
LELESKKNEIKCLLPLVLLLLLVLVLVDDVGLKQKQYKHKTKTNKPTLNIIIAFLYAMTLMDWPSTISEVMDNSLSELSKTLR